MFSEEATIVEVDLKFGLVDLSEDVAAEPISSILEVEALTLEIMIGRSDLSKYQRQFNKTARKFLSESPNPDRASEIVNIFATFLFDPFISEKSKNDVDETQCSQFLSLLGDEFFAKYFKTLHETRDRHFAEIKQMAVKKLKTSPLIIFLQSLGFEISQEHLPLDLATKQMLLNAEEQSLAGKYGRNLISRIDSSYFNTTVAVANGIFHKARELDETYIEGKRNLGNGSGDWKKNLNDLLLEKAKTYICTIHDLDPKDLTAEWSDRTLDFTHQKTNTIYRYKYADSILFEILKEILDFKFIDLIDYSPRSFLEWQDLDFIYTSNNFIGDLIKNMYDSFQFTDEYEFMYFVEYREILSFLNSHDFWPDDSEKSCLTTCIQEWYEDIYSLESLESYGLGRKRVYDADVLDINALAMQESVKIGRIAKSDHHALLPTTLLEVSYVDVGKSNYKLKYADCDLAIEMSKRIGQSKRLDILGYTYKGRKGSVQFFDRDPNYLAATDGDELLNSASELEYRFEKLISNLNYYGMRSLADCCSVILEKFRTLDVSPSVAEIAKAIHNSSDYTFDKRFKRYDPVHLRDFIGLMDNNARLQLQCTGANLLLRALLCTIERDLQFDVVSGYDLDPCGKFITATRHAMTRSSDQNGYRLYDATPSVPLVLPNITKVSIGALITGEKYVASFETVVKDQLQLLEMYLESITKNVRELQARHLNVPRISLAQYIQPQLRRRQVDPIASSYVALKRLKGNVENTNNGIVAGIDVISNFENLYTLFDRSVAEGQSVFKGIDLKIITQIYDVISPIHEAIVRDSIGITPIASKPSLDFLPL